MTGVLARAVFRRRTWSRLTELAIFVAALALFYAVLAIGRTWLGPFTPAAEISRSPRALPGYAAYSVGRIVIAYALSLAFALGSGRTVAAAAARHPAIHPRAEFPARRNAGYGGAVSSPAVGARARGNLADFHRPGVEHRF